MSKTPSNGLYAPVNKYLHAAEEEGSTDHSLYRILSALRKIQNLLQSDIFLRALAEHPNDANFEEVSEESRFLLERLLALAVKKK